MVVTGTGSGSGATNPRLVGRGRAGTALVPIVGAGAVLGELAQGDGVGSAPITVGSAEGIDDGSVVGDGVGTPERTEMRGQAFSAKEATGTQVNSKDAHEAWVIFGWFSVGLGFLPWSLRALLLL